jgi:flavin-dependent dehydrogenase
VGDAANLVDPFSGEGIYAAVKSGRLAAQHITRGLAAGDLSFRSYGPQIEKEFTRDYGYAQTLGRVFYRMPVTLLKVYVQSKPLHRFTEDLAHADMDYHALVSRSLRKVPRFLFYKAIRKVKGQ